MPWRSVPQRIPPLPLPHSPKPFAPPEKDDLIDAMVDQVIREIEFPSPAPDWKTAMRQRAISAHQVLVRHAWATMPMVSRMNVGPAMLRYVDATLGCLREAGFSPEMADHAWNAIDSHIYGFTLQELNFPLQASDYAPVAQGFMDRIPSEQYPYLHQLAQLITERKYDGIHDFEFGLDLLLDGLEKLRDSHFCPGRASSPPPGIQLVRS